MFLTSRVTHVVREHAVGAGAEASGTARTPARCSGRARADAMLERLREPHPNPHVVHLTVQKVLYTKKYYLISKVLMVLVTNQDLCRMGVLWSSIS